MKYFFLALLFSCASVPKKVIKTIHEEKLAGYWSVKSYSGRTNFVRISCEGEIKFDYKEEDAIIFRDNRDEGKIKRIKDNEIAFKSWTSIRRGMKYRKPYQFKPGCYEFDFNNWIFTGEPADCSKPKETLAETFNRAFEKKVSACDQPSPFLKMYEDFFKSHLVAVKFGKKAAQPKWQKHEKSRRYKTRITEQWKKATAPNFAGHYFIPGEIGCGTGCAVIFAIEWETGDVFFPDEDHASQFRQESNVLIQKPYDICTGYGSASVYEFSDKKFKLLKNDFCPL